MAASTARVHQAGGSGARGAVAGAVAGAGAGAGVLGRAGPGSGRSGDCGAVRGRFPAGPGPGAGAWCCCQRVRSRATVPPRAASMARARSAQPGVSASVVRAAWSRAISARRAAASARARAAAAARRWLGEGRGCRPGWSRRRGGRGSRRRGSGRRWCSRAGGRRVRGRWRAGRQRAASLRARTGGPGAAGARRTGSAADVRALAWRAPPPAPRCRFEGQRRAATGPGAAAGTVRAERGPSRVCLGFRFWPRAREGLYRPPKGGLIGGHLGLGLIRGGVRRVSAGAGTGPGPGARCGPRGWSGPSGAGRGSSRA